MKVMKSIDEAVINIQIFKEETLDKDEWEIKEAVLATLGERQLVDFYYSYNPRALCYDLYLLTEDSQNGSIV